MVANKIGSGKTSSLDSPCMGFKCCICIMEFCMEFCIGTMGLLVTLLMLGIILEELMGIMLLGAILPGCILSFRLLLPLAAIPYKTAQSPV